MAYVGLVLVLLGAIPGLRYTVAIFTTVSTEGGPWGNFGPALFAVLGGLLASAGALLALIGGIIAEFIVKPRHLWIAMIVVGLVCILSLSGLYYEFYRAIFDSPGRLKETDLLFRLMFPLPVIACTITGVVIGVIRKLKRKPEHR